MLVKLTWWLIKTTCEGFVELWDLLKGYVYLILSNAILLVGVAKRNAVIIIFASLIMIMSYGYLISDGGMEDVSYIIKGKRVWAKKFLKIKKVKAK